MSGMKRLSTSPTWKAAIELADATGEACAVVRTGRREKELERVLAQAIRVASCVTLGLEATGREEREELLSEGRQAAASLAAKVHVAVSHGSVSEDSGLAIRRKIRVLVDSIDLESYRLRRRAG
ncbi:MAG: hypothetical protein FD180_4366 [Planctomycetota bacterium]|nr:MAG: hypothetical protein FD180_4366 [Planctomycetota bacterium]